MLSERNVTLVLEPSARELLMREGYDPTYGARPLKRAIQSLIQNPLAVKLLQGEIQPGQTVRVSANGDVMEFKDRSGICDRVIEEFETCHNSGILYRTWWCCRIE